MMSDNPRATWTIYALVISCVMNLFLGGVITGIVTGRFLSPMMAMEQPHFTGNVASMLMERLTSGLAEKDQQIIRHAFAIRQTDLVEKLEAARLAKLKVHEALRVDPFDQSKFDAALETLDSKMSALPRTFQSLMKEVAPRISVDSRRELADRLIKIGPP